MALPTNIRKAFIDHPASVNETYFEHFAVAAGFSRQLAAASAKALVHAIVPGMCCTSASEKIKELNGWLDTGSRDPHAETVGNSSTA